jgi:hypothetical protein
MTIPYSMIGLMSQGDLVVYPLKVKPIRHGQLRRWTLITLESLHHFVDQLQSVETIVTF